jgi:hypothetical protein
VHRHYEDAISGKPICANIPFTEAKGSIEELVELHQISLKLSPFVSWTISLEVAKKFAGLHGVVLVLDIDSPNVVLPEDFPNDESEVLTVNC